MGRPRNLENLYKQKENTQFSEGQKSKGILDDFAVRKVINTQEGTIEKVPVNNSDIANKKYVDDTTIALKGRWIKPYHWVVAVTNQAFTAGRVLLSEFEVASTMTVDQIVYIVGSTLSGSVTVGIYGPIATEETASGAALAVESASTAQGSINTSQAITITDTVLTKGRYYLALEGDNAAGTYQRIGNQTQVVGWGQYYDRAGGYGALTNPCPTPTNTGSALPGIVLRIKQ